MTRGAKAGAALFWAAVSSALTAAADVTVPVSLQAQLAAKLSAYDLNFAARSAGGARVLVIERVGENESVDVGDRFAQALSAIGTVGSVSATVEVAPFTSAPAI